MNTRNIALNILLNIEENGAYSNLELNNTIKKNKLSHIDASFVSALVYGVLERQITLDYIIKQYSKIPMRKIDNKTKIILRLGILQLLFMDKIPESAAVNESVNLAKKNNLQKSTGFINGILRNITRAEVKYSLPDENKDYVYYLSVKYSCPLEVVRIWLKAYKKDNTIKILESLSGRPPLTARVNTLKTDIDSLIKNLEKEGIKAEKSSLIEDAVCLSNTGSIELSKSYKNGDLYIQDIASQLCVKILNPEPDDIMYDICSAPGGKSFTSAQYMKNTGEIHSFDIYEHKLKLISDNAHRLGITNIFTAIRNGETDTEKLPLADKVLCDVPCSGMGILRRKPEIRYKKELIENNLPDIQYSILTNSSKLVKVGGVLVYSTCTLSLKENEFIAKRFLRDNPDFEGVNIDESILPKENYLLNKNMVTLFPSNNGTDGFFISVFKRIR